MDTPWTVGMVLVRPSRRLGSEPFYQEFVAGLERGLEPSGATVVLRLVADEREMAATYRRWTTGGDVAAVLLTDLALDDPRIPAMRELGMAAVIVGDPRTAGGFPAVWTDDAGAMRVAVAELVARGHRRIGRVSGPPGLAHTRIRSEAFAAGCAAAGVSSTERAGDYAEASGRAATRAMLAAPEPPTAIVYDDDLMALGGLAAAREAEVDVPGRLSIVAWDDSTLCQLSSPPLAVMGHDVRGVGELAAAAVIALVGSGSTGDRQAATPRFVVRGSVGVAPG